MTARRRSVVPAVVAAASLLVAGCASRGSDSAPGAPSGTEVTTSSLAAKLAGERDLQTLIVQSALSADVTKSVLTCLAGALQKDADPTKLRDYVAGKASLSEVTDKGSTSTAALGRDATGCLKRLAPQVVTPSSTSVRITG